MRDLLFKGKLTKPKHTKDKIREVRKLKGIRGTDREPVYITKSPEYKVLIKGILVRTLIDIGAEINVISPNITNAARLAILDNTSLRIRPF